MEPWPETLVQPAGSYGSSSSSGDWGWDPASEQSSPSSPSPPLPPEAAFLFGEPAPRKRKVSTKGQCSGRAGQGRPSLTRPCRTGPGAGPVPVSVEALREGAEHGLRNAETHPPGAPGVRRGPRAGGGAGRAGARFSPTCSVPSRRRAEPAQSDGEEDFYYTELDIGLEVLTDGLSSLTPTSPTASLPPTFPHLELPEPPALPSLLHPLTLPRPQVCDSDHSYQVGEVTGSSWVPGVPGREQDHSCVSFQGCLAPTRLQPQPSTVGACVPALPAKLNANLRCVRIEGQVAGGEGPNPTAPHAPCVFP